MGKTRKKIKLAWRDGGRGEREREKERDRGGETFTAQAAM